MEERRSVLVTGLGVVCGIGTDTEMYRDALLAGRSGVGILRRQNFLEPPCYAKVYADIEPAVAQAAFERVMEQNPGVMAQRVRGMRRASVRPFAMGMCVGLQALGNAGLAGQPFYDPARFGCVAAAHNLDHPYITQNHDVYFREEPDFIDPDYAVACFDTDVVGASSQAFGLEGPCFTVGAACASGNVAICEAVSLIRSGRADAVLVLGCSGEPDPVMLHNLVYVNAMTSGERWLECPERSSRPFDGLREGFVPGFGYSAVVLEARETFVKRQGGKALAEVTGIASGSCRNRTTRLDPVVQARIINDSLVDAHVQANEIGYINAHATGTQLGDAAEAQALRLVFGEGISNIPVNATKSMIGHTVYASGVMEFTASVLQMNVGQVHPTINQEVSDPELAGFDFVPNVSRAHSFRHALSNGFGFGGLIATLVLSTVE